jgi:hypothetical protein
MEKSKYNSKSEITTRQDSGDGTFVFFVDSVMVNNKSYKTDGEAFKAGNEWLKNELKTKSPSFSK